MVSNKDMQYIDDVLNWAFVHINKQSDNVNVDNKKSDSVTQPPYVAYGKHICYLEPCDKSLVIGRHVVQVDFNNKRYSKFRGIAHLDVCQLKPDSVLLIDGEYWILPASFWELQKTVSSKLHVSCSNRIPEIFVSSILSFIAFIMSMIIIRHYSRLYNIFWSKR